jgi:eukaryotic-like serine/threonine-protein kinase
VNPAQWSQLRGVLEAALDAPESDREALLERLCPDEALRREARALLEADDSRLDPPANGAAGQVLAALEGAALVGEHAGPYRLLELIAVGGMGEVFKAVRDDGAFDRTVAVKLIRRSVLSPEAGRRFAAERRLLARLSHPNIAALLDGGRLGDRPYIVLEYVEGLPLREHCERHGLSVRERVLLLRTICGAVAHAHQHLIVHRDLKPSNVLVTPDGAPKLLDFGISKLLSAPTEDPTVTAARLLTPRYASPEQLRGQPVTTASDVYSLGVILHETLTGRPWGADTTSMTPQLTGEIAPPSFTEPGIDRELDAIVLQALAPDPSRRYPSAESMGVDLQRYLDGERVTAYPATRLYRAAKWASRHRLALGAGLGFVLLISTTAVVASVVAARLSAERRQTLAARDQAEQSSRFLTAMLESAGDRAVGGQLTLGAMLDDASTRLAEGSVVDPVAAGRLRHALGLAYMSMGRHTDAGPLLTRSVADLSEVLAPADPRLLRARGDLARYLTLRGDFTPAAVQFDTALGAARANPSPDHELIARLLCSAGFARMVTYDYTAADRLYHEGLDAARTAGSAAAESAALRLLGQLALIRGQPAEAVEWHQQALEAQRRATGPSSSETADALGALGEAHLANGDPRGAEALIREALAVTVERRGAARAAASSHQRALAGLLERTGRAREAEALYLEGIRTLAAGLPASRHDWVYLRENYGRFLVRQGRPAEARPHFELAARAYEELLGAQHQRTRMARQALEQAANPSGAETPR